MEILEIEELKKELEKLKDLKIYVFEGEVYVKVEDYREKTIENRKLNERIKELENELEYVRTIKDSAEETLKEVRNENKKLKEELKKDNREVQVDVDKELLKANDYLIKENKKLKKEIEFLEQCLDNKEKVNKSLREDLKIWKLTAKDYAKQCGVDLDE